MSKIAAIIGRFLIALIFIFSGAGKLMDIGGTETMIVAAGLPSGLAIPTGLFELVAGLCLAAGFMVRLVAILLAGFTAMTILFFHAQFGDPMQRVMMLKNFAIIGGLALAFAHSQMWSHYYLIASQRRGELAARDSDERVRDAELRAAKAEARADALENGGTVVAATPTAYEPRTVVTENGVPVKRRSRFFDW
ncbi:membrane protein [Novosphingobium barchaimii LL02]|uniref:Membrane protein n=1 Tax=Novosphingobium barchaimii LL02 TaxID=1114963 RepID=A0A0J7XKN9_9SPHN|nr:DoxX family protein [Novosphingobium barchaimii]KMS52561.1 membrane protein [Novosphingobium barchaimii LL02]